ncbi:hypothetical protein GURASL_05060 [Geotalea uraniireducens]|uniref:Uncharacterized protein n=1 Tax=Geotalea uraniireducens TaxID=351604 RepID=A0ABM8EGM9_9BACT|nr:hypothetical protein [Geotalea uraniireducens]BDV41583.1 hypothetical protein GURASL_05060 [Geotalea uraniireducens]
MVGNDDLKYELERNNFVRAAQIAASRGLAENELREIQFEALWQMAQNRNAVGTRKLAQEWGVSKQELKEYLQNRAVEHRKTGDIKLLTSCYDAGTGKYFSFEEWLEFYAEKWKDYQ